MNLLLSESPEDLEHHFTELSTPEEVAELLKVDFSQLKYLLYVLPEREHYTIYRIPKKAGGLRTIAAPIGTLKVIQRTLDQVLRSVYGTKRFVHGFVAQKSILTNAQVHSKKRYVFNLDLKDFFPSITFPRVRGMFMGPPYKRPEAVATILAQICCFNGRLPQGAPTSPVVSNMLCGELDDQLLDLAYESHCVYSRYADDLTFSTDQKVFPAALAIVGIDGTVQVGKELRGIIEVGGFAVNLGKVRLQPNYRRQEVTGLVTNQKPNVRREYVRQIRAMLHAWEKYGLDAAQRDFLSRYDTGHRNPYNRSPKFGEVVKGKIEFLGMVRGRTNPIYLHFCEQLRILAPELVKGQEPSLSTESRPIPKVFTEGMTDWQHLKTALSALKRSGRFRHLEVEFDEIHEPRGDEVLRKWCEAAPNFPHASPQIFIFDYDNPRTIGKVAEPGRPFKKWGSSKVYSFCIPVPPHRPETSKISIKHYYTDEDLQRRDEHNRRLYQSSEFDRKTLRLKTDKNVTCSDIEKIRNADPVIIQSLVFDTEGIPIAMSKSGFARHVEEGGGQFTGIDFSPFAVLFDVILQILDDCVEQDGCS